MIADPPRCGLDPEILNCIVSCGPKNFIYISCEPASLARDLKILARQYSIKETFCYDMFPQTMHIETSIFCTRR
ncbi:MAG TPA: hypothetical protein DC049_15235 [Spirochaetia bacterium]|nr:hypothetical protein [Spirochaetia bacterium]